MKCRDFMPAETVQSLKCECGGVKIHTKLPIKGLPQEKKRRGIAIRKR